VAAWKQNVDFMQIMMNFMINIGTAIPATFTSLNCVLISALVAPW